MLFVPKFLFPKKGKSQGKLHKSPPSLGRPAQPPPSSAASPVCLAMLTTPRNGPQQAAFFRRGRPPPGGGLPAGAVTSRPPDPTPGGGGGGGRHMAKSTRALRQGISGGAGSPEKDTFGHFLAYEPAGTPGHSVTPLPPGWLANFSLVPNPPAPILQNCTNACHARYGCTPSSHPICALNYLCVRMRVCVPDTLPCVATLWPVCLDACDAEWAWCGVFWYEPVSVEGLRHKHNVSDGSQLLLLVGGGKDL